MSVALRYCTIAAALMLGCAGDQKSEADGGPSGETSLGELPLSSLSDAQRAMLCAEFEELEEPVVDAYDEALCTFAGLLGARFGVGSCTEVRDSCLSDEDDESEEEVEGEDVDDDCPVAEPSGCGNVTVAELRRCMEGLVARDERAGKQVVEMNLTCDSELPEELNDDVPESCEMLTAKCPTLTFEQGAD